MEPLLFLIAMIGIIIIVWWSVINDHHADPADTEGFLAMKDLDGTRVRKIRRRRFVEQEAAITNRFYAVPREKSDKQLQ